jgi:CheY-like chemotaxis protein
MAQGSARAQPGELRRAETGRERRGARPQPACPIEGFRPQPGIAVVVLSGKGSLADRVGHAAGADDYVGKPSGYAEAVRRR